MKLLVRKFFSWYISYILNKDFKTIHFNQVALQDTAVLLLANHFSWWDGFLYFHINKIYLRKKFHVMVSEENYRNVWFLKYLGAFPVYAGSRKVIESLQEAGALLNNPENLVLVFPQGKLYSNQVQSVEFERGVSAIINSSEKKFQYLFAATFVDYFEKRKPSFYCYLKLWQSQEYLSLQLIKKAYNNHYEHSRQLHSRHAV